MPSTKNAGKTRKPAATHNDDELILDQMQDSLAAAQGSAAASPPTAPSSPPLPPADDDAIRAHLHEAVRRQLPAFMEYQRHGYNMLFPGASDTAAIQSRLRTQAAPAVLALQQALNNLQAPAEAFLDNFRLFREEKGMHGTTPELALFRMRLYEMNWDEHSEDYEAIKQGTRLCRVLAGALDLTGLLSEHSGRLTAWKDYADTITAQQRNVLYPLSTEDTIQANIFASLWEKGSPEAIKFTRLISAMTRDERLVRENISATLIQRAKQLRVSLDLARNWSRRQAGTGSVTARFAGYLRDACPAVTALLDAAEQAGRDIRPAAEQPADTGKEKGVMDTLRGLPKEALSGLKDAVKTVENKSNSMLSTAGILTGKLQKNAQIAAHKISGQPSRPVQDAVMAAGVQLLDEIQKMQAALGKVQQAAVTLQGATEELAGLKTPDGKRGSTALENALAQESARWQEKATAAREQLPLLVDTVTQRASEQGKALLLSQLREPLAAATRTGGTSDIIEKFDGHMVAVVKKLVKTGEALRQNVVRLSEHGAAGGSDLNRRNMEWLLALKDAKGLLKRALAEATGQRVDNFSRSGMLARMVAEWAETDKQSWLTAQPEESREVMAERYQAILPSVMADYLPLLGGDGGQILAWLRPALTNAEAGTTLYPATMVDILAGMKSTDVSVRDWARRRLGRNILQALGGETVKLVPNLAGLAPRILLRCVITGVNVALAARKGRQGIRGGEGDISDEIWRYALNSFTTAGVKTLLSLPPGLPTLLGVAAVAADIYDKGAAGTVKKQGTVMANELPWQLGRIGLTEAVNAVAKSTGENSRTLEKLVQEQLDLAQATLAADSEQDDDESADEVLTLNALDELTRMAASPDALLSALATGLTARAAAGDIRLQMSAAWETSHYDAPANVIRLRADAPDRVILHEIAHALTARQLHHGLKNPGSPAGQLRTELDGLRQRAAEAWNGSGGEDAETAYYLTSVEEFVAGLYSGNEAFLRHLSGIDVEGEPLLTRVVKLICGLLGLDESRASALTEAMRLSDRLMAVTPEQSEYAGGEEKYYWGRGPATKKQSEKPAQKTSKTDLSSEPPPGSDIYLKRTGLRTYRPPKASAQWVPLTSIHDSDYDFPAGARISYSFGYKKENGEDVSKRGYISIPKEHRRNRLWHQYLSQTLNQKIREDEALLDAFTVKVQDEQGVMHQPKDTIYNDVFASRTKGSGHSFSWQIEKADSEPDLEYLQDDTTQWIDSVIDKIGDGGYAVKGEMGITITLFNAQYTEKVLSIPILYSARRNGKWRDYLKNKLISFIHKDEELSEFIYNGGKITAPYFYSPRTEDSQTVYESYFTKSGITVDFIFSYQQVAEQADTADASATEATQERDVIADLLDYRKIHPGTAPAGGSELNLTVFNNSVYKARLDASRYYFISKNPHFFASGDLSQSELIELMNIAYSEMSEAEKVEFLYWNALFWKLNSGEGADRALEEQLDDSDAEVMRIRENITREYEQAISDLQTAGTTEQRAKEAITRYSTLNQVTVQLENDPDFTNPTRSNLPAVVARKSALEARKSELEAAIETTEDKWKFEDELSQLYALPESTEQTATTAAVGLEQSETDYSSLHASQQTFSPEAIDQAIIAVAKRRDINLTRKDLDRKYIVDAKYSDLSGTQAENVLNAPIINEELTFREIMLGEAERLYDDHVREHIYNRDHIVKYSVDVKDRKGIPKEQGKYLYSTETERLNIASEIFKSLSADINAHFSSASVRRGFKNLATGKILSIIQKNLAEIDRGNPVYLHILKSFLSGTMAVTPVFYQGEAVPNLFAIGGGDFRIIFSTEKNTLFLFNARVKHPGFADFVKLHLSHMKRFTEDKYVDPINNVPNTRISFEKPQQGDVYDEVFNAIADKVKSDFDSSIFTREEKYSRINRRVTKAAIQGLMIYLSLVTMGGGKLAAAAVFAADVGLGALDIAMDKNAASRADRQSDREAAEEDAKMGMIFLGISVATPVVGKILGKGIRQVRRAFDLDETFNLLKNQKDEAFSAMSSSSGSSPGQGRSLSSSITTPTSGAGSAALPAGQFSNGRPIPSSIGYKAYGKKLTGAAPRTDLDALNQWRDTKGIFKEFPEEMSTAGVNVDDLILGSTGRKRGVYIDISGENFRYYIQEGLHTFEVKWDPDHYTWRLHNPNQPRMGGYHPAVRFDESNGWEYHATGLQGGAGGAGSSLSSSITTPTSGARSAALPAGQFSHGRPIPASTGYKSYGQKLTGTAPRTDLDALNQWRDTKGVFKEFPETLRTTGVSVDSLPLGKTGRDRGVYTVIRQGEPHYYIQEGLHTFEVKWDPDHYTWRLHNPNQPRMGGYHPAVRFDESNGWEYHATGLQGGAGGAGGSRAAPVTTRTGGAAPASASPQRISSDIEPTIGSRTRQTLTPAETTLTESTRTQLRSELGEQYNTFLLKPKENCANAATEVAKTLRSKGYTDVKIHELGIWPNGGRETMPANHYVVMAKKDGADIVVDLTAGQFEHYGFSGPIISTKDDWMHQWQQAMQARPRTLVKMAPLEGGISTSPFSMDYVDPQMYVPGGELLQRPAWYKNSAAAAATSASASASQAAPGTKSFRDKIKGIFSSTKNVPKPFDEKFRIKGVSLDGLTPGTTGKDKGVYQVIRGGETRHYIKQNSHVYEVKWKADENTWRLQDPSSSLLSGGYNPPVRLDEIDGWVRNKQTGLMGGAYDDADRLYGMGTREIRRKGRVVRRRAQPVESTGFTELRLGATRAKDAPHTPGSRFADTLPVTQAYGQAILSLLPAASAQSSAKGAGIIGAAVIATGGLIYAGTQQGDAQETAGSRIKDDLRSAEEQLTEIKNAMQSGDTQEKIYLDDEEVSPDEIQAAVDLIRQARTTATPTALETLSATINSEFVIEEQDDETQPVPTQSERQE